MTRTLSGRLALMMTTMFVGSAGLFVAMSVQMPQVRQVVALGAELLVAAVAFALIASLLVFGVLTRRLHLLSQEMEAFRESRFTRSRRLPWADARGDEIDRLAHAFGELAERMSAQLNELQHHDVQRRELMANVSHDLRTPLTLMQGYLDTLLLRRGEMSPAEERGCLEVAARHAERLGHLVAALFELAKLEAPGGPMDRELFSLKELVQDTAQKFGMHAERQGVRVRSSLPDDGVQVEGNIGLVERALENLVENALRHTPPGGEVRIALDCDDAAMATVRVQDTGCGIAPEHLPHVFERYFQAPRVEQAGAAARPGHAGLGLAITRRIVALHGGAIRVASEPGRGTEFAFDLPRSDEVATGPEGAPCLFH